MINDIIMLYTKITIKKRYLSIIILAKQKNIVNKNTIFIKNKIIPKIDIKYYIIYKGVGDI